MKRLNHLPACYKFTESSDGRFRTSVPISIRLTENELVEILDYIERRDPDGASKKALKSFLLECVNLGLRDLFCAGSC